MSISSTSHTWSISSTLSSSTSSTSSTSSSARVKVCYRPTPPQPILPYPVWLDVTIQCVCESTLPSQPTPPHPSPSSLTRCDWTSPSSARVRVLYYEGSTARRVTAKLPVLRPWFWNLMFPEKKNMVSPRALVAQLGVPDCLRCLMCGSRWLSCVYWMMSVRGRPIWEATGAQRYRE